MTTETTAMKKIFILLAVTLSCAACAPEVGSERWCQQMSDKPKGEWTANEAADYANHCLLK